MVNNNEATSQQEQVFVNSEFTVRSDYRNESRYIESSSPESDRLELFVNESFITVVAIGGSIAALPILAAGATVAAPIATTFFALEIITLAMLSAKLAIDVGSTIQNEDLNENTILLDVWNLPFALWVLK